MTCARCLDCEFAYRLIGQVFVVLFGIVLLSCCASERSERYLLLILSLTNSWLIARVYIALGLLHALHGVHGALDFSTVFAQCKEECLALGHLSVQINEC